MEKNDQLELNRQRSVQAIVSDGYRLYVRHFWRLLRSSWIQAIVYALVIGLSMAWFFTRLLPRMMAGYSLTSQLLTWLATIAASVVAALLLAFAGGIDPLHEHSLTNSISRPRHWWGRWPWRLTLRGLKRLPQMLWLVIRRRRLGTLIVVSLIMMLMVAVATAVLQLPTLILATANVEAAAGMAVGDAVDMPENLFLLNFATFSACSFLQAYIHLSTLFPLYYVWGAATTKQ